MVSFNKRFIVVVFAAFSLACGVADVQASKKRKDRDEKHVQQRKSKRIIKKVKLFVTKIVLLLQGQKDAAYKKYINNATVKSFKERLERYKEQSSQIDQNDVVLSYQGKDLKLSNLLQFAEQGLNQLSALASVSDSKEVYDYSSEVSDSDVDASGLEDKYVAPKKRKKNVRKKGLKRQSEEQLENNVEQSKKSKSDEKKDVDDIDGTPLDQPSADLSSFDEKPSNQDQKLEAIEQKTQVVVEEVRAEVSTDQKTQELVLPQAQQELEHEEQKQQDDWLGLGIEVPEQKTEEKQKASLDLKHSHPDHDNLDDEKIAPLDADEQQDKLIQQSLVHAIATSQLSPEEQAQKVNSLLEKITDALGNIHPTKQFIRKKFTKEHLCTIINQCKALDRTQNYGKFLSSPEYALCNKIINGLALLLKFIICIQWGYKSTLFLNDLSKWYLSLDILLPSIIASIIMGYHIFSSPLLVPLTIWTKLQNSLFAFTNNESVLAIIFNFFLFLPHSLLSMADVHLNYYNEDLRNFFTIILFLFPTILNNATYPFVSNAIRDFNTILRAIYEFSKSKLINTIIKPIFFNKAIDKHIEKLSTQHAINPDELKDLIKQAQVIVKDLSTNTTMQNFDKALLQGAIETAQTELTRFNPQETQTQTKAMIEQAVQEEIGLTAKAFRYLIWKPYKKTQTAWQATKAAMGNIKTTVGSWMQKIRRPFQAHAPHGA